MLCIPEIEAKRINYDHSFMQEEIYFLCEKTIVYHYQYKKFENSLSDLTSEDLRNEVLIINTIVSDIILSLGRLNDDDRRVTSFWQYLYAIEKHCNSQDEQRLKNSVKSFDDTVKNLERHYRHKLFAHRNKDEGAPHFMGFHDAVIKDVRLGIKSAFHTFDSLWQSDTALALGFKHRDGLHEDYRKTLKNYF